MPYPPLFLNFCLSTESRLTSLRKSILYILWSSEKPLKAYELLNALQEIKKNSKPPTVYRVLDHFVSLGIVHKIESIQSYMLCTEPKKHLASEVLMLCNNCHQVQEIYDKALHAWAQKLSMNHTFHLGENAIELKGLCELCYQTACFLFKK